MFILKCKSKLMYEYDIGIICVCTFNQLFEIRIKTCILNIYEYVCMPIKEDRFVCMRIKAWFSPLKLKIIIFYD